MMIHDRTSIQSRLIRVPVFALIATIAVAGFFAAPTFAQKRRAPVKHLTICGNPTLPCKSAITFEPHTLPFRMPENAVIYDTELFYAIILKSVNAPNDSCDAFVPEAERLAAQALFPANKVFASRCAEPGEASYTNTNSNQHFMAVYAGLTIGEANRMLAAVQATGRFAGANIRRMRVVVNGT